MADRKKVLDGLELCLKGLCDICPYKDSDAPGGCKDELMYDAMLLLKALDVTPEELERLKMCRAECKIDCLLEHYNKVKDELDAMKKAQEPATIKPKRIDLEEETKAWLDEMDAVDALVNIADICIDWDGYRTANGLGGLVNEIWAYARYCADRLAKAQEPPTSASISSAIECLLHPQDADDSDMAKAIDTAIRAMRLFKAQEPRVLALDEIHRGMVVWLEDKDKSEPILAIGGASAGGAKCFITVNDMSVSALDDEYNIRWRAWTDCPSKEEMGATPWNVQK